MRLKIFKGVFTRSSISQKVNYVYYEFLDSRTTGRYYSCLAYYERDAGYWTLELLELSHHNQPKLFNYPSLKICREQAKKFITANEDKILGSRLY